MQEKVEIGMSRVERGEGSDKGGGRGGGEKKGEVTVTDSPMYSS